MEMRAEVASASRSQEGYGTGGGGFFSSWFGNRVEVSEV